MVDRLANVLQDLARSGELQNAVDLLHRSARGVDGEKDTEQHESMSASSSSYANPRSRGAS